MLKQLLENGKAVFVCPQCSKEFEGECFPELAELYKNAVCPECVKTNESIEFQKQKAARKNNLSQSVNDRMANSGFQGVFCSMETPVTRHNAEFLWRNKDENLLISGETGAGKTSSAAFVIRVMLKERKLHVLYKTWSALYSEYVKAKVSDDKKAEDRFFERLNNLDYLIIDEIAWRRGSAKLSPAAQELFFNIVDDCYNQSRKCKVWLLGNLHGNALGMMFDHPEPVIRRLNYRFKTVQFDFSKEVQTLELAGVQK